MYHNDDHEVASGFENHADDLSAPLNTGSASEGADTAEFDSVQHSDWFQTLVTVPLLAASAGAVFMLLPSQTGITSAPSSASQSQAAAAAFGYDGHDHAARREHVVMARMESQRARLRPQVDQ